MQIKTKNYFLNSIITECINYRYKFQVESSGQVVVEVTSEDYRAFTVTCWWIPKNRLYRYFHIDFRRIFGEGWEIFGINIHVALICIALNATGISGENIYNMINETYFEHRY